MLATVWGCSLDNSFKYNNFLAERIQYIFFHIGLHDSGLTRTSFGDHHSQPIIVRNMILELTWDPLSQKGVGLLNFHVVVDGPSQTFIWHLGHLTVYQVLVTVNSNNSSYCTVGVRCRQTKSNVVGSGVQSYMELQYYCLEREAEGFGGAIISVWPCEVVGGCRKDQVTSLNRDGGPVRPRWPQKNSSD